MTPSTSSARAARSRSTNDGIEHTLRAGAYLCGAFSVADIGYFLTITFATNLGAPLTDAHPKLHAWYAQLLERAPIRKEMQGLLAASTA